VKKICDIESIYIINIYIYTYIIFMRARELLQRCRAEIFLVSFIVRPFARRGTTSQYILIILVDVSHDTRIIVAMISPSSRKERKKEGNRESERKRER